MKNIKECKTQYICRTKSTVAGLCSLAYISDMFMEYLVFFLIFWKNNFFFQIWKQFGIIDFQEMGNCQTVSQILFFFSLIIFPLRKITFKSFVWHKTHFIPSTHTCVPCNKCCGPLSTWKLPPFSLLLVLLT